MTRTIQLGSVEYLAATVTSDVTLTAQPVAFSFDQGATWLAAAWIGAAGLSRSARLLVDGTILPTKGPREVLVKVTDSPETPIVSAGTLLVS